MFQVSDLHGYILEAVKQVATSLNPYSVRPKLFPEVSKSRVLHSP